MQKKLSAALIIGVFVWSASVMVAAPAVFTSTGQAVTIMSVAYAVAALAAVLWMKRDL